MSWLVLCFWTSTGHQCVGELKRLENRVEFSHRMPVIICCKMIRREIPDNNVSDHCEVKEVSSFRSE